MALYCEHPVDSANDDWNECGKEIEGMYDGYCLKHMDTYKCSTCNHTPNSHDNIQTQEREYCHEKDCKCLEYVGEV